MLRAACCHALLATPHSLKIDGNSAGPTALAEEAPDVERGDGEGATSDDARYAAAIAALVKGFARLCKLERLTVLGLLCGLHKQRPGLSQLVAEGCCCFTCKLDPVWYGCLHSCRRTTPARVPARRRRRRQSLQGGTWMWMTASRSWCMAAAAAAAAQMTSCTAMRASW
jgi:hypothetical protein